MYREIEVFAIEASNSSAKLANRWVIYAKEDNYEVYLETTKQNKVAKVHASAFKNKYDAVDFIAKMDKLCTNGNAYQHKCGLSYEEC